MNRSPRRVIWGWVAYDWANSTFATTVMAGFFPLFFKQFWNEGVAVNLSTARLGWGNALAGLLVFATAPVLGAMADRGRRRKGYLLRFAALGVAATAALFLVGRGQWLAAIVLYSLGVVGFAGANVFYDALLPLVAPRADFERVSALGYAAGYLGGGLLFLLNVAMLLKPQVFGLPDAAAAVRWSFLSVALWWGGFSLVTARWVPEPAAANGAPALQATIVDGLRQLRVTLGEVRLHRPAFVFLVAYWFYIDGVDTVIRMAVDYGLSLGFAANDLIAALLMVQFIGFPAALVFGRLGQRWGVRPSLFLGLGVYVAITIWAAFIEARWEFYGVAAAVGLVQGGVQALSRAYYARLIPAARSAEFFGLYNMMGKFAAIVGPALMGTVSLTAERLLYDPTAGSAAAAATAQLATRLSIISVVLLFLVGAGLLLRVERGAELRADG
jgi:UMF1 family MFS transporter